MYLTWVLIECMFLNSNQCTLTTLEFWFTLASNSKLSKMIIIIAYRCYNSLLQVTCCTHVREQVAVCT